MTDSDSRKDRGFYHGGRVGSWLGLALAFCGTVYLFVRAGWGHDRSLDYWIALCLAGPMLVCGGWLAGKFAGSYLGELFCSGKRELIGFFVGAFIGLFLAEGAAGAAASAAARSGLWFVGILAGAFIGRTLGSGRGPRA